MKITVPDLQKQAGTLKKKKKAKIALSTTGRTDLEKILFISYTFHLGYTWLK